MRYAPGSFEERLLENDPEALGQVIRWIAVILASPRFWPLRNEWHDLHQDVLVRVIESLRKGRFDPSREFHFYVQGIARYTALQAMARRAGSLQTEGPLANPGVPATVERGLITRDLVRRVLDCASEDCRELIRAYFFEGQDYSALAVELSVPVGTIKSRLFRCLENAHVALSGRGPERKGPPDS